MGLGVVHHHYCTKGANQPPYLEPRNLARHRAALLPRTAELGQAPSHVVPPGKVTCTHCLATPTSGVHGISPILQHLGTHPQASMVFLPSYSTLGPILEFPCYPSHQTAPWVAQAWP